MRAYGAREAIAGMYGAGDSAGYGGYGAGDSGEIWRARHRAAPIERKKRRYRDYATCAAAALPSNVKNFFSFAIKVLF